MIKSVIIFTDQSTLTRQIKLIDTLEKISIRFWPGLKDLSLPRKLVGIGDVITTLYSLPTFVVGIIWLIADSDFSIFAANWQTLLLFTAIIALYSYLNFFMIIEFRHDRYGSSDGAFNSMAVWATVLIFGP
ncbi:MAG: hypothetical protein P8046_15775, partial [Anaerolineales bacterium]